jgi:hypothetical protein
MTKRAKRRWAATLAITASALGGFAAVAAAESAAPVAVEATASASGLRVIRDPETGRLVSNPSAEQLQALALQPRRVIERTVIGLRPFELDRGGQGINLQGRFASALRVRVAADGTFETTCGDPQHAPGAHEHGKPVRLAADDSRRAPEK